MSSSTIMDTSEMRSLYMSKSSPTSGNVPEPVYAVMHTCNPTHIKHVMRNPAFCISLNKRTDQLHSKDTVDWCLCFCCIDSAISLISKYEIATF